MKTDYYRVLELKPGASAEEVQRAYRALALRYHPDRNPAPDASTKMTSINEAYEVLGDPERRREYDVIAERPPSNDIGETVLEAARECVLRSGWPVLQESSNSVLLENGGKRLRIVFIARLNNAALSRICRQYTDRTIVLAVHIETPINLGLQTRVVDLMHSSASALPSLLAPFL